jgi:hypothetical protein
MQTVAHSGAFAVKVEPETCRGITAHQNAWLGPEWKPYLHFVKACEIKSGKITALYLLSVWGDDYYRSLPPSAPAPNLPKPVLVSPQGKILGRLPEIFPRDPPRTLDVTFARWVSNFPHEIRLHLEDPAVTGDRVLPPLVWDADSQTYVTIEKGRK